MVIVWTVWVRHTHTLSTPRFIINHVPQRLVTSSQDAQKIGASDI